MPKKDKGQGQFNLTNYRLQLTYRQNTNEEKKILFFCFPLFVIVVLLIAQESTKEIFFSTSDRGQHHLYNT